jgi:hypothetical protein
LEAKIDSLIVDLSKMNKASASELWHVHCKEHP